MTTLSLAAILLPCALVAGCRNDFFWHLLVTGFPTTPMTVPRADEIFRKGIHPGQSREVVEAWLASQGFAPLGPNVDDSKSLVYVVMTESNEGSSDIRWMESYGANRMAEAAGLKAGDVKTVLVARYPDADRQLGRLEVRVFLFFDGKGRLLRHWADFFYYAW